MMNGRRIAMLLGITAVLSVSLTLASRLGLNAEGRQATQRAAQEDAFRAGGYAAAAAINGTFVRTVTFGSESGFDSLEELVRASQVIVVGTIVGNKGVLVPRGDAVRTHYRVDVGTFLKWPAASAHRREIVVSVIGGRAALPDGMVAQEVVTEFVHPANRQRLVMFLNEVPAGAVIGPSAVDAADAEYWPTLQRHGLYVVEEDRLRSADLGRRLVESPSMKYRGAPLSRFLAEIRTVVGKQNGR